jgi:hypothetical protein
LFHICRWNKILWNPTQASNFSLVLSWVHVHSGNWRGLSHLITLAVKLFQRSFRSLTKVSTHCVPFFPPWDPPGKSREYKSVKHCFPMCESCFLWDLVMTRCPMAHTSLPGREVSGLREQEAFLTGTRTYMAPSEDTAASTSHTWTQVTEPRAGIESWAVWDPQTSSYWQDPAACQTPAWHGNSHFPPLGIPPRIGGSLEEQPEGKTTLQLAVSPFPVLHDKSFPTKWRQPTSGFLWGQPTQLPTVSKEQSQLQPWGPQNLFLLNPRPLSIHQKGARGEEEGRWKCPFQLGMFLAFSLVSYFYISIKGFRPLG